MSKLLYYIYHVKLALSDKNSNIRSVQFYSQQIGLIVKDVAMTSEIPVVLIAIIY